MRLGARRGGRLHSRVALLGLVAMVGATVAVPATAPKAAADTTQCPWMDARQSPDRRAGELVAAMTTDEKISMLHSAEPTMGAYYGTAGHVAAIPRLCIPDLVLNDAGAGVADAQVNTTAFPAGIAQAASWDRSLQQ